ncbi:MAG: hypothetical protein E6K63_00460 [Nitrospirae bacterium]|nr:MAG: hypothetical protein E6K63_00460 [Nitrospirota bacterium]
MTIEGAVQGKAVGQAAVILLAALLGMALTLSGKSYAPGIDPLTVARITIRGDKLTMATRATGQCICSQHNTDWT